MGWPCPPLKLTAGSPAYPHVGFPGTGSGEQPLSRAPSEKNTVWFWQPPSASKVVAVVLAVTVVVVVVEEVVEEEEEEVMVVVEEVKFEVVVVMVVVVVGRRDGLLTDEERGGFGCATGATRAYMPAPTTRPEFRAGC